MKLKRLYIERFRCYQEPVIIEMNDMTALIGRNDIGKSTIMEALEVFFNNEVVKITQGDLNNLSSNDDVVICCEFEDLPEKLVLDSNVETDLISEYLLTKEGTLLLKKVFDCSKKTPTAEIFIVANHPTAEGFSDLLNLKQKELQVRVKELELEAEVNLSINSEMRKAIWSSVGQEELCLQNTEICVSKAKEGVRDIWTKVDAYMPLFALFQSDRHSTDGDSEVQNPMKQAIQMAIAEANDEIQCINEKVRRRAMEIAGDTYQVLRTLDDSLASTLAPRFDPPALSKWTGLYNISMDTGDSIPLNKRGSGVRRMVLLSFFKAEADRKALNTTKKDVIYAIEEPETSMHPSYQHLMIESLLELSRTQGHQVILTTHSPSLATELPVDSLRFISRNEERRPIIESGEHILPKITQALGVLPNSEILHKVQVIICLEGPTDVLALKCFSRCLREKYPNIVDLDRDDRIAIIPLGGSILKHWVSQNYLQKLHCKEVHIYDRDVDKYQEVANQVNNRKNGSWAVLTKRYEIENYLHPKAIKEVYNVEVDTTQDDVPKLFGQVYSNSQNLDAPMKGKTAKTYLSRVFENAMKLEHLIDNGAEEEIKGWFDRIGGMLVDTM